jgi:DNA replication protein DnaC
VSALEDFDFNANPKIPAARIRDLATLRFLEASESVILHGPVGVGKTMVAQALGHQACRRGYSALFTKTSRLLADLAGGHADHTWETQLKRWHDQPCSSVTTSPSPRPTTSTSW